MVPGDRFNHSTTDYDKWFEYNGFRYKDVYKLRLMDDTIIEAASPNADHWHLIPVCGVKTGEVVEGMILPQEFLPFPESPLINLKQRWVTDADVKEVMLLSDDQRPVEYALFKGADRIIRNRNMFSEHLSENEDMTVAGVVGVIPRYLSFRLADYPDDVMMLRGHKTNISAFVLNGEGVWTGTVGFAVKIGASSAVTCPYFNVVKQLGAEVELAFEAIVEIKETDTLGTARVKPSKVTVFKQGRQVGRNWELYFKEKEFDVRTHFSFKRADKPNTPRISSTGLLAGLATIMGASS